MGTRAVCASPPGRAKGDQETGLCPPNRTWNDTGGQCPAQLRGCPARCPAPLCQLFLHLRCHPSPTCPLAGPTLTPLPETSPSGPHLRPHRPVLVATRPGATDRCVGPTATGKELAVLCPQTRPGRAQSSERMAAGVTDPCSGARRGDYSCLRKPSPVYCSTICPGRGRRVWHRDCPCPQQRTRLGDGGRGAGRLPAAPRLVSLP